jgi:hypothetical protein
MSHEAVRAFYRKLSESSILADNYYKLTHRWLLGHNKEKIVAYAASLGFTFTVSELAFVRLTNMKIRSGPLTGREVSVEYYTDYEPTLHPHKPGSPKHFYETQNRHVDGAKPTGAKLLQGHDLRNGVCQNCGCSETYIEAHNPSCHKVG